MAFAQAVIGPPGSGKTTYCRAMADFLEPLGRSVAIINLDPANDHSESSIDIRDLIDLEDVMARLGLGPNGALIYCMEYLAEHMEWLREQVIACEKSYYLIDMPGQVELYTHQTCVKKILSTIEKDWKFRVCAVHLVDSHYCSEASKFIAIVLTSLATMIRLELPHVNVLSKIDIAEAFGELAFGLDFYTEVLDLQYLFDHIVRSGQIPCDNSVSPVQDCNRSHLVSFFS
jgi:GTPase SAR1 family protein